MRCRPWIGGWEREAERWVAAAPQDDICRHHRDRAHREAAKEEAVSFGERLASLRKAAGFTQIELAAELGIPQRMVACYESPPATPPAKPR